MSMKLGPGSLADAERQADKRAAALAGMPSMPPLREMLARLWAAHIGETWDDLTPIERQVRTEAMDRAVTWGTGLHHH